MIDLAAQNPVVSKAILSELTKNWNQQRENCEFNEVQILAVSVSNLLKRKPASLITRLLEMGED